MTTTRRLLAILVLFFLPSSAFAQGEIRKPAERPVDMACSDSTAPSRTAGAGMLLTCLDGTIYSGNGSTWTKAGSGGGSGVGSASPNQGLFDDGGSVGGDPNFQFVKSALATPSAPAVTPTCTVAGGETCSTTYTYFTVTRNVVGGTVQSADTTITNGPDTLTVSNFNSITPGSVLLSSACEVWNTAPNYPGFLATTTCGAALVDDGSYVGNNFNGPLAANTTQGAYLANGIRIPAPGDVAGRNWIGNSFEDFGQELQGNFLYGGPNMVMYAGPHANNYFTLEVAYQTNAALSAGMEAINLDTAVNSASNSTGLLGNITGSVYNIGAGTLADAFNFRGSASTRGGPITRTSVFWAQDALGPGTSIVNQYGHRCSDLTKGQTVNACLFSAVTAGVGKYSLFTSTALSHFGGDVELAAGKKIGGLDISTSVSPASSGTRYLCISTTGVVTSSASACSGT